MLSNQKTVREKVTLAGLGLHSGDRVGVSVYPAPADTGILFWNRGSHDFWRPDPKHVITTQLATTIEKDGFRIATIEHLLAALYGAGIDNAIVCVAGAEVPILDGSALPFTQALGSGLDLGAPRKTLSVASSHRLCAGGSEVVITPACGLEIEAEIDYPNTPIGRSRRLFRLDETKFSEEIAFARTFARLSDVEIMRAGGLIKGGSLENAVVVDEHRVLNQEGLRAHDEFVRHKILDIIGDLALVGVDLRMRISVSRPGHGINNLVARFLHDLAGKTINSACVEEEGSAIAA